MCGIVGAVRLTGQARNISAEYICALRDTMVHRGPDGAGVWAAPDGSVGLGHRRLSIIDLSEAAAQPMFSPDGSVAIVFNGEIYNHRELRAQLILEGVSNWKTDHSDTEVILRGYQLWGRDVVKRLRGIFSFGIWDARREELWLVRDRVGVKPLYYSQHDGRFVFASEIKALLEDRQQRRSVDVTSLFHYLSFLASPAPATMFEGIRKVPAGSWLVISAHGVTQQHQYWDVWSEVSPRPDISESDAIERLREMLSESVQLRAVSDVPVGVFLSGGVDSSANAALFAKVSSTRVKTFSVGYKGDDQSHRNELVYARQMSKLIDSEQHEILLSQAQLIDFLPRMIAFQDEPIGDPVCVPLYFVSKLARDSGVTVSQIGEGADELFCGYPAWARALRWQEVLGGRIGRHMAAACSVMAQAVPGASERLSVEYLRRAGEGRPIFWGGAEAFTEPHKRRLLTPSALACAGVGSSWEALVELRNHFERSAWERSDLNWMTYLDLSLRLPELLLMRVDKMSMATSLEGREPFLDHKMIEFVLGLPTALRYRRGELKRLLKAAVRGLLPDEIIDRPKQGFSVPLNDWMRSTLGAVSERVITEFCRRSELFRHDESIAVFRKSRGGAAGWYLLNVALWWFHYIERRDVRELIA